MQAFSHMHSKTIMILLLTLSDPHLYNRATPVSPINKGVNTYIEDKETKINQPRL